MKNKIILSIYSGIIIIFIYSCSAKTKLSNYNRGSYEYGGELENIIKINTTIIPTPQEQKAIQPIEKNKTVFDFSEKMSISYFEALAKVAKKPEEITDGVKINFNNTESTGIKENIIPIKKNSIDKTSFDVTFVISNIKKYYNNSLLLHPNTRLEFLVSSIKIDENSPFRIKKIDKIQTEYETLDFGKIERENEVTNKAKLSGNLDLSVDNILNNKNISNTNNTSNTTKNVDVYDDKGNKIGTIVNTNSLINTLNNENTDNNTSKKGLKADASWDYSNRELIKEAIDLKSKKMKTGFSFNNKELTISQRGNILSDISENIYVTATLELKGNNTIDTNNTYSFEELFASDLIPNSIDNLNISKTEVTYIPCKDSRNLTLRSEYEGLIRAVKNTSKSNSILEFDDLVTYYKLSGKNTNILEVDKKDYCSSIFTIKGIKNGVEYLLYFYGEESPIKILDTDKPSNFSNWINKNIQEGNINNLISKKYNMVFIPNNHNSKPIFLISSSKEKINLEELKSINIASDQIKIKE